MTNSGSTTVTTVQSATTTTVAEQEAEAAILAAYRAHWNDFIAVAETFPVKPLDPRLASHATGKQLTSEEQFLTRLSLLNHYNQGPTDLAPRLMAVNGNTASVTDCIFDHSVEVDFHTKSPVEQPDVGHTLDSSTLISIGGVWYVSDSTIVKSGKTQDACVPPIA